MCIAPSETKDAARRTRRLMKKANSVYKSVLTAPRVIRLMVGLVPIVGGVFRFLPVLGFWMIPLGLLVIYFDVLWVREMWR